MSAKGEGLVAQPAPHRGIALQKPHASICPKLIDENGVFETVESVMMAYEKMGRSAGSETEGSDRESLHSDVTTGEGAIIVEWGMPRSVYRERRPLEGKITTV